MAGTRAGIKRKRAEPLTEADDNVDNLKVEDTVTETKDDNFKSSLKRFHYSSATDSHVPFATSPRTTAPKPTTISPSSRKNARRTPQRPLPPPTDSPGSTSTTSPSSIRKPKSKHQTGYAPPSTYAHLPVLTDIITPNLITLFVGTNPGIRTATAGHAYAHPSNLFWKLLHISGCTDRRLDPSEDVDLPRLYAMGNINIVERPTRNAGELSRAEMVAGAPILEEKVRRFRPESVCIVGKGIWEAVWRHRYGRGFKDGEFKYGWQGNKERMGGTKGGQGAEDWEGARVFVSSSTSGLAASLGPREKEEIWRPFGEWVKAKREERTRLGMENPVWEGATRVKQEEGEVS